MSTIPPPWTPLPIESIGEIRLTQAGPSRQGVCGHCDARALVSHALLRMATSDGSRFTAGLDLCEPCWASFYRFVRSEAARAGKQGRTVKLLEVGQ